MEIISIDDVIRNLYEDEVNFIRSKNVELEREYFSQNAHRIPLGNLLQGASYEEHYASYKSAAALCSDYELSEMLSILNELLLFSAGHDLMFKTKLEADYYTSLPLEDLIYPLLTKEVKKRYNDLSVMREHPNARANITGIAHIIHVFTELQSLLYMLYCHDFQFINGWEGLCPDVKDEVLRILNESGMTIGDFLRALIDHKCSVMRGIFSSVQDPKLRQKYLEEVEKLRAQKYEETKGFGHVDLPVTYFQTHTMMDFIQRERKSPIVTEDPGEPQELYFPRV